MLQQWLHIRIPDIELNLRIIYFISRCGRGDFAAAAARDIKSVGFQESAKGCKVLLLSFRCIRCEKYRTYVNLLNA